MKKKDIMLYYNPKYHGFHILLAIEGDIAIMSGCCSFVDDAYSTKETVVVPVNYLRKLVLVNTKYMELYYFVASVQLSTGKWGYRVDEDIKDLTYKFYSSKWVLNHYYTE